MNDTSNTKTVVINAQRPYVQRYFMLIFLVIAAFMLFVLVYIATGLAAVSLSFLVFTLILYGIIVGLFIRNGYKRHGYVFSNTTRYLVLALIAAVIVSCLTVSLGDSGTATGNKNLITVLFNLPRYHYFADDILEMSGAVYGLSAYAYVLLMPITGIMIAVDAKNKPNDDVGGVA